MDEVGILGRILQRSSPTAAILLGAALASGCSTGPRTDGAGAAEGDRLSVATPPVAVPPARSTRELRSLERAVERFAADRAGRLPVALDELTRERSPEGDHYLASVPLDPWGRPYAYAVVSARLGAYDLRSYGPDTLPGTPDDLVSDAPTVPVR